MSGHDLDVLRIVVEYGHTMAMVGSVHGDAIERLRDAKLVAATEKHGFLRCEPTTDGVLTACWAAVLP